MTHMCLQPRFRILHLIFEGTVAMMGLSKYFRISVTNRCNLNCTFCHREGDQSEDARELSASEVETACKAVLSLGFRKVKLTGGEPTLHGDIFGVIRQLSALKIPDFSMITNGTRLVDYADALWEAGLRRLNVTLNTLNQERFITIQRAPGISVTQILRGIERAKQVGFHDMKINFVFSGADSQTDLEELMAYTKEQGLMLVLLPVLDRQSFYSLEYLHQLILRYGVETEDIITDGEGIQKRLIRLSSGGRILLRVDELAQKRPYPFCARCETRANCREGIFPIRLSAEGELIPCMASEKHRISILSALRAGDVERVRSAFFKLDGRYRIYETPAVHLP